MASNSKNSIKEMIVGTEDGRSMTTFYYYSVNHQSGLQRNIFSKLSYIHYDIKTNRNGTMCRIYHGATARPRVIEIGL